MTSGNHTVVASKSPKYAQAIFPNVDAGAKGTQRRRLFMNTNCPAAFAKCRGKSQSAKAGLVGIYPSKRLFRLDEAKDFNFCAFAVRNELAEKQEKWATWATDSIPRSRGEGFSR